MSNQGWAKLNNSPYKRICPGLCPTCVHLNTSAPEWHKCDALGKLLSNPHTTPGKCDSYKAGEQKLSDEYIEQLNESVREYQEAKKRRKASKLW